MTFELASNEPTEWLTQIYKLLPLQFKVGLPEPLADVRALSPQAPVLEHATVISLAGQQVRLVGGKVFLHLGLDRQGVVDVHEPIGGQEADAAGDSGQGQEERPEDEEAVLLRHGWLLTGGVWKRW